MHRFCKILGFSTACCIDYVNQESHLCFSLRKNNKSFVHWDGNVDLFASPYLQNHHQYLVHNQLQKESIKVDNFEKVLQKFINWNCKSLSIGYIPSSQLSLLDKYWKRYRNDKWEILWESQLYRLHRNDLNQQIRKIQCKDNIIIKPLNISDIDKVLKLIKYPYDTNYEYIKLVIQNNNISLGAYIYYNELNKLNKLNKLNEKQELIGCAFMHLDDMQSFGGLAIDERYRRKGIAFNLIQIILKEHFENTNDDFVVIEIDSDNIASQKLHQKIGFKQIPEMYYWIANENAIVNLL